MKVLLSLLVKYYRLLWQSPSVVLSRDLDLVRDGTALVMSRIAAVFAYEPIPPIYVKLDDLHERPIDAFAEVSALDY